MRIERLALRNYRQFRNLELTFDRNAPNDLHIVIGMNGTGKTNILNAINWCLYGDEPHLSKDSQQLPRLNLGCVQDGSGTRDEEVAVELWIKTIDGNYLTFERKELYRVGAEEKHPLLRDARFEARVTDERGNTEILADDEATYCVERFVPQRIREFFFFDGERLDRYFKEVTSQNIRHAVFELSQIHVLEKVQENLESTLKDLRKEAGKASPAIEETRSQLDKAEEDLAEIERQIEVCANQVNLSRLKIAEYEEELRGLPDTAALEKERQGLNSRREQKGELRRQKVTQKNELLFEHGISLTLWPAIFHSLQTIDDKREKKEIPPTIDRLLLESILQDELCSICGRELDEDSTRHVRGLAEEIRLSSDIARELLNMENPLRLRADRLTDAEAQLRRVTAEMREYETDLAAMQRRKDEIDRELLSYDAARITEWHKERQAFEHTRDSEQKKLGVLETRRGALVANMRSLQRELDQGLKKEAKLAQLSREIHFCGTAQGVVRDTKQAIMAEIRQEIESETKALFLALAWKSETFGDVRIDENYNIHLTHSMGYECLGTVGAAERELLALSFTLALHNVSGFDSPILIDTPVARVSDQHRVNFGKVLLQVSAAKQTVLLFTPAEHSEDLAEVIDRHSSNRLALKLSSDEMEARVEVL